MTKNAASPRRRVSTHKGVTTITDLPVEGNVALAPTSTETISEAPMAAPTVAPALAPATLLEAASEAPVAITDVSAAPTVNAPACKPVKAAGRVPTTEFRGFGQLINTYAAMRSEKAVVVEALRNAGCKSPEAKLSAHVSHLRTNGLPIIEDSKTHIHYVINGRSGKNYF